jgi:hypothetical protein
LLIELQLQVVQLAQPLVVEPVYLLPASWYHLKRLLHHTTLNNNKTQVSKSYLLLTSHQCPGVGVLYIQIILTGFKETISMKQVFLRFYLNNGHSDKIVIWIHNHNCQKLASILGLNMAPMMADYGLRTNQKTPLAGINRHVAGTEKLASKINVQ